MASKKTTRRKKTTTRRKTTSSNRKTSAARKSPSTTTRRKKTRRTSTASRGSSSMSACLTGAFEGDINTRSHMHFAENCRCRGKFQAPSMQIDGTMNGSVVAPKKISLGSKAQIRGELVTDTLVASQGAAFDGHCKLGRMRKAA
jgi:cytoskeletal protein CcmA (bactofilin family)